MRTSPARNALRDSTTGGIIVHNGQQIEKVSVLSDGGSGSDSATTFYPSSDPNAWTGDDTGPSMSAWIPNLSPGAWSITANDDVSTATVVVSSGAITFVLL